jgi:hypothetical protein
MTSFSVPTPYIARRTNVERVVDEKGANHHANQGHELDGPHAVLQARAHVPAALHANHNQAEEGVENSHREEYAVHAELAPSLHC